MNLHSFIKGTASALAAAFSFCVAATFSGCASSPKNAGAESSLPKIDMSKWLYNKTDDVYYQLGLSYAANPSDAKYENLAVFVPGSYFDGTDNGDGTFTAKIDAKSTVRGFSAKDAPFVMPIQTPGYAALEPPSAYVPAAKQYTDEGFIFVYAGARGRDSGAPSGVTDFKAAIRYVRYNKENLPGDTRNYFTYGMSGGGAQSAILGAAGDAPEYEPYLQEIGAVMSESDAVLGSMDWCPITNLNVADAAYEWELGVARTNLSAETKEVSDGLSKEFALYINSLGLKDEKGNTLTLEQSADGLYHAGTYYDYLKGVIETSLNNFLADTEFPYNADEQKAALGQNMILPAGWKPRGPRGTAGGNAISAEDMDGVGRNAEKKSGNVDLSGTNESLVATKSVVVSDNVNEYLSLRWQPSSKMEFGVAGNLNYQHSGSEREDFTTLDVFSFNYGLTTKVELPWGMQVSSDLTMYSRRGYSESSMNTNELVWNARLSKRMMKGKLTLMFDGFDLLGNLSNVQRTVNAQGRAEVFRNVIPSYGILHVIYRLNRQPQKK